MRFKKKKKGTSKMTYGNGTGGHDTPGPQASKMKIKFFSKNMSAKDTKKMFKKATKSGAYCTDKCVVIKDKKTCNGQKRCNWKMGEKPPCQLKASVTATTTLTATTTPACSSYFENI